ncbi:hypothetical protein CSR02_03575 [Acetobacter pomorum]|uniref:Uncharacterized protein n=1 Tax=Acetobacter pomorum TaxID=65959 RepID=A0A2G4REM2_9PROT|nr:hypothetical protein CSR02_03575 [Acetobacter pomorum]
MAKIIQKVLKDDVVGFRCDVCNKEYAASDDAVFSLTHTCGFASDYDTKTIRADICDNCLMKIVRQCVPGAEITD